MFYIQIKISKEKPKVKPNRVTDNAPKQNKKTTKK